MWLNVSTNSEFAQIFNKESYPALVIYSHGKTKKFVTHEGEFSAASICKF
jgi:hypothetical protein